MLLDEFLVAVGLVSIGIHASPNVMIICISLDSLSQNHLPEAFEGEGPAVGRRYKSDRLQERCNVTEISLRNMLKMLRACDEVNLAKKDSVNQIQISEAQTA